MDKPLNLKETFVKSIFWTSFQAFFVLILSEMILSVFLLILSFMCWNYFLWHLEFTVEFQNLLQVAVWSTQCSFSIGKKFLDFTQLSIFGNDFYLSINVILNSLNSTAKRRFNCHSVHPPHPPGGGGGGGWTSNQFSKRGRELDRASTFRGELLGKREVTFFRGGRGVAVFT